MTQEERDSMYIANCKCCTLAEVMKDCKACKFSIGLPFKATIKQEANPSLDHQRERFSQFAAGYLKNIPNSAK